PYLLYAGGISPHKDIPTLLEAYALVRKDGNAPRLVIAGALDADPYHSAADAVRERIGALGIADGVLLTGYVTDDVLACLYSAASAVALPSLAEGFGLPAVEAAACGAAVVLSDIPAPARRRAMPPCCRSGSSGCSAPTCCAARSPSAGASASRAARGRRPPRRSASSCTGPPGSAAGADERERGGRVRARAPVLLPAHDLLPAAPLRRRRAPRLPPGERARPPRAPRHGRAQPRRLRRPRRQPGRGGVPARARRDGRPARQR